VQLCDAEVLMAEALICVRVMINMCETLAYLQVADEVLSNSRVVRTFNTEKREKRRYDGWLEWLYQVSLRQATGYGLYVISSHMATYASKVVVLFLGEICSVSTIWQEQSKHE
jgi:ABC-type multidrug transport system fused ATPase/permease subunit